jgi:hypothetical protein
MADQEAAMFNLRRKVLGDSMGAKDSLSTKAEEKVLFPETRAFGNKAQLQQLQSATAAFLLAKQAFLDAKAAKVTTPEQE